MEQQAEFLVPDYFPGFQCKIGGCRHVCCSGWPVTISMRDYFRMVGIACSPELRRSLDTAIHILPRPSEAEYAQICPGYDGTCPIRMKDGRCRIQAELGEEVLPVVCRLFPRGIRARDDRECSCANSCEAVTEIFLNHPEPLRFIRVPFGFELPPMPKRENLFETAGRGQDIRLHYIRIIQDRNQPLPGRLMSLGIALQKMEKALRADDRDQIGKLLAGTPDRYEPSGGDPTQEQLEAGLEIASFMLKQVDERSRSVKDYGEAALQWFAGRDNSIGCYHDAIANFDAVIPNWQIVFEHLLVNHMFFEQFPFQDRPVPVRDEFLAICAVYTLLRFLSVGWTAIHPSEEAFVDVCSALFRLVSHTAFDRFAADMLKQLGCVTPEQVYALIRL